ncbi:MAG: hypothetical protein AB7O96_02845 [Pseudobdellovibrionaceae bacterium]
MTERTSIGPNSTNIHIREYAPKSTSNGRVDFLFVRSDVLGRTDVCNLKVTSARKSTDDREFNFNSRGDIFVNMNGTDSSPGTPANKDQVTTCQYRVLPQLKDVEVVDSSPNGSGLIRSASGIHWLFNKETGKIDGKNSCQYTHKETGSKDDNCGFNIEKCAGSLVLGWKATTLNSAKDRTPASNPAAEATVYHPSGKTCTIKNKDILDYKPNPSASLRVCVDDKVDSCREADATFDEVAHNKEIGAIKSALKYHSISCSNLNWDFLGGGPSGSGDTSTGTRGKN